VFVSTFFLVSAVWSFLGRNFVFRRLYRRDIRYKEETHVSLSDQGVTFAARGADANCHWDRFLAHSESKNLFLLYPSERIFYIVPKLAFEPCELAEARGLLTKNIPSRRVPWHKQPWGISLLMILLMTAILIFFLLTDLQGRTWRKRPHRDATAGSSFGSDLRWHGLITSYSPFRVPVANNSPGRL